MNDRDVIKQVSRLLDRASWELWLAGKNRLAIVPNLPHPVNAYLDEAERLLRGINGDSRMRGALIKGEIGSIALRGWEPFYPQSRVVCLSCAKKVLEV
jgi:hypothetical protein